MNEAEFLTIVTAVPANAALLDLLPSLELPQCHLTAGCLFQPVWNARSGLSLDWGIKDFDVFYFDDTDLSWEAEDEIIQQANRFLGELAGSVEIRNQARVHLWYEQRFGKPISELASARDGIDRFLISCTCLGIEVSSGALYAPNGLTDIWAGILRMNPRNPQPVLFQAKAEDYQARWPWLTRED